MQRAFTKIPIPNPLRIVSDGKEAIAYLAGTAPFESRAAHPIPCLMLMDLSMPGRHGLQVLSWIKSQPSLADLPVVIFSSSNQETDIIHGYELGASGFMIKPGDPQDLIRLMTILQQYWLTESRPPGTFVDFAGANVVRPPKAVPA